jgi:YgiT-type zinc finger domain-containing protein
MIKITICPVCGAKVNKVTKDWVSEFRGQEYIVPNLEYYVCLECGERIYPHEAIKKIEAFSPAYQLAELA